MKDIWQNFVVRGQLVPSSRYLVQKMIRNIDFSRDMTVLQLGFGNGVFTKALLERMTEKSRLIVFEIRPECQEHSQDINDKRLRYICDSAEYIHKYFLNKNFDHIISTLPLANMKESVRLCICQEIRNHLKEGGVFLQYQYSLHSRSDICRVFKRSPRIGFEVRNFPPAFIYEISNDV